MHSIECYWMLGVRLSRRFQLCMTLTARVSKLLKNVWVYEIATPVWQNYCAVPVVLIYRQNSSLSVKSRNRQAVNYVTFEISSKYLPTVLSLFSSTVSRQFPLESFKCHSRALYLRSNNHLALNKLNWSLTYRTCLIHTDSISVAQGRLSLGNYQITTRMFVDFFGTWCDESGNNQPHTSKDAFSNVQNVQKIIKTRYLFPSWKL